jgi:RNA polymerase sigma-70 factor (sigma-E family)
MFGYGPDHSNSPAPDEAGFQEWMTVRAATLRRKAFLLTGDWHTADDLVQDTVIAVYARWSRIARGSNIDSYARRVLVHKFIDDRRRPWRRERPVDSVTDSIDARAGDAFGHLDNQDEMLAAALAALPAGQRAVLVLRFTDDLTIDEVAAVMDLRSGTVKSRLSRGSDALRRDLVRRGHPAAMNHPTYTPVSSMEDPT